MMLRKKFIYLIQGIHFNIQNFLFYYQNSFALPLVTIVVPVYNEERFIAACLDSIKKQSYKHFECIVVNDCSTDNSSTIVEKFIGNDSRFTIINHKRNRGLSASRNTGIEHAKGGYITFLDADDFLFRHSIWRRVEALKTHDSSEIAGSYCHIIFVSEAGQAPFLFWAPFEFILGTNLDFISSRGECPFNVHAPLLKLDIIKKFGGFNEMMRQGAEDWELWIKILRHGYRFIFSHIVGGAYRQKRRSMINSTPSHHVQEGMRLITQAYQSLSEKNVIEGTPYVFREPLNHYQIVMIKTQRIIKYAVLAYLAGDNAKFEQILTYLVSNSGYYLEKWLDFNSLINSSIARFYGLDATSYQRQKEQHTKVKEEILHIIRKKITS